MQHHSFSPSKLESFDSCHAAWKICRGFTSPSNPDEARGTRLHEAFYNDSVFAELDTQDQDLITELRNEYLKKYQDGKFDIRHELRVSIVRDGVELSFGTLDCLIIAPDGKSAALIDLKFGYYEVTPAGRNLQIKAYVAGVFQMFPKLEKIFALIVQPAFGIGNYDDQAVYTRSDVPAILDKIADIEAVAQNCDITDLSQYRCSLGNCRYCNKNNCPKYKDMMIENMKIFGLPETDMPNELAEMTVAYADRLKCGAKTITDRLDYLTALANKVILASGGSANYVVRAGRTTKRIDWRGLCRAHNITPEDIAEFTTEREGEPYLFPRMTKQRMLK